MKRFAGVLLVVLGLAAPLVAQDRTPEPTGPKTEAQRLEALERRLQEQQKEIDALRAGKKPALDEKGAVKEAEGKAPLFEWGYDDGFFVKGEINGAPYKLRPRVRLQLDYRAFPHSQVNLAFPHAIPEDQFLVRRARVGFGGNFGPFEFTFDVDPIRNPLPIGDFWLQWHQWDEFQVRLGQFKAPFDYDDFVTSDLYIDMVERPIASGSGNQIAPDYRIGAMVFGKIADGLFNYALAVTNQPDSNTVPTGDPLFSGRIETDFKGFEAGVGAIFARLGETTSGSGTGKSFTGVTPGQFTIFPAVNVRGWEQGYVADAAYYFGPVWVSGGYAWAQQERNRIAADGTDGTPLVTQGGWVTVGWMFWAPTTPGPHGIPCKDWDLLSMDIVKKRNARNVGMELVCRIETMDIRDARGGRRFTSALQNVVATPSTQANALKVKGAQCQAATFGLNFYPIENVKFMADYVLLRTGDQQRGERPHSHLANEVLLRAQLEF